MMWRTVASFPDYEVSEVGDIRRLTPGRGTRPGNMPRGLWDRKGYRYYRMPGGKMARAHRLVALAFCEPFGGDLVRHLDGNTANNHRFNLAWGTALDNTNDRRRHGRRVGWHHLQTECKWGHPLTEGNFRMKKEKGRPAYRLCLQCRRDQARRRYRRDNQAK